MDCIQVQHDSLPFTYSELVENDPQKNANLSRDISLSNGNDRYNCTLFIRNVCKRYGFGPLVLRNFCMKVKKGTIYGLLGSSGCGKTTILSCIVGLQKCDSGEILVFGRKPGTKGSGIPGKRLGYMPQEMALYRHLTIKEIIRFYGRVYGMTSSEINEQWKFLNTLLKLPSDSRIITDLSGGQQRRVSLALALIHSPELLILDEPTVGLDPLLRRDIWEYLHKIVRRLGTTIIITTHYIEEARNSCKIGVMRNGRLLVEDTPPNLLRDYNCELLEQVVQQLCRRDANNSQSVCSRTNPGKQDGQSNSWHDNSVTTLTHTSREQEFVNEENFKALGFDVEAPEALTQTKRNSDNFTTKDCFGFPRFLQRIYGFTTVTLLSFLRNPACLLTTLIIPGVQGTMTLLCVGSKPGGIQLGIVNPELTNWTTECDSPIHLDHSCDLSLLSCKFINHLKRHDTVVLNPFNSEYDALSQSHLGRISGYLTFPENYSQHSLELFSEKLFASNESIEGSRIHVHLDYSQNVQALLTIKHLFTSYLLYLKDLASSCEIGDRQAELPLLYRTPVFGKEDDYTSYIIPGLFLVTFIGIGFMFAGMMIISDRKEGTLSRAHVAGLTIGDVLTSHLLTHIIVAIGEIVIWNIILYYGFSFEPLGSPGLIILFCLLTQWCGVAIGIFMAQIFMEEMHVLCMAIFLFLVFIQLTSTLFPKELMSVFWRKAAYVVPTTIPTEALRSIMIRGIGITDPFVWSGLLILVVWTAVLLLVSVLIYKKINK